MGAPHRSYTYRQQAAALVARANADPTTRCWRCNRSLDEHPAHRTGRPPFWTAGHTTDSEVGGQLRPEASVCNYRHGGWRLVNTRRRQRQPLDDHADVRHW